jgi:hypothetical protein
LNTLAFVRQVLLRCDVECDITPSKDSGSPIVTAIDGLSSIFRKSLLPIAFIVVIHI